MCQCTLRPLLLSGLLIRRKLLVEQRSLRQHLATSHWQLMASNLCTLVAPKESKKSLHLQRSRKGKTFRLLGDLICWPFFIPQMVSIWTWHIPSRWARCSVPSRLLPKCWAKLKCLPNSAKFIQAFKLIRYSYDRVPVWHQCSTWMRQSAPHAFAMNKPHHNAPWPMECCALGVEITRLELFKDVTM